MRLIRLCTGLVLGLASVVLAADVTPAPAPAPTDKPEKLTAKGVEFIRPPTARPWGSSDAQFKDNSGNTWLLLQSGPGSQA